MKKLFILALSVASLTLMSCKSEVEKRTEDYCQQMVEAMKANDLMKVLQIGDEMAKWQKTLTPEELEEAVAVSKKYDEQISEASSGMNLKGLFK